MKPLCDGVLRAILYVCYSERMSRYTGGPIKVYEYKRLTLLNKSKSELSYIFLQSYIKKAVLQCCVTVCCFSGFLSSVF